jgi:hypothetical protein
MTREPEGYLIRLEKENERLVAALEHANTFIQCISGYPTCNDCGAALGCEHIPAWGNPVRYNCPFWRGKDEVNQ